MTRFPDSGLDRRCAPALGAPPAVHLPPIAVSRLANGLTVMVVERHDLPLATFTLMIPRGSAHNPPDQVGVAQVVADMLLEGTTTRSSLEISDEAAFLGVSLDTHSAWDATTITLNTPTAQLDAALALFADVALRPAFPHDEFERLKKERLTELLQLKDHSPVIADRVYASVLFGAAHPYGRPASGTEQSIGSMTVETVKSFYKKHFASNSATLIIVGDVTRAEAEMRAADLFGAWQNAMGNESLSEVASMDTPTVVTTPTSSTISLVDKPGAEQASFRVGHIGVARTTPDYFPLQVMNTILGGAFTSRLNQNLRETRGYTYGAFSRFDMRRMTGPFVAVSEIVAAHADDALQQFVSELSAIRELVPEEELAKAKQYLALQLPGTFETNTAIAQRLTAVALYGLSLEYYNQYVDHVGAVTQDDVLRVARTYVTPEALTIVIVADRATVEPALRALRLAPIHLRDFNGGIVT